MQRSRPLLAVARCLLFASKRKMTRDQLVSLLVAAARDDLRYAESVLANQSASEGSRKEAEHTKFFAEEFLSDYGNDVEITDNYGSDGSGGW